MRRRTFLWLAFALGASSGSPRAQPRASRVVGFLNVSSAAAWSDNVAAFQRGLAEAGYSEGRNVAIEFRWANGDATRLPGLAAELVRSRVDVVVATGGTQPILAAMGATKTIPIVFTSGADPVARGFVASLAHPGGNVTGVTLFTGELVAKRLALLRELIPGVRKVAVLGNPVNPNTASYAAQATAAARELGVTIVRVDAATDAELAPAFAAVTTEKAGGLLLVADPFFESRRSLVTSLAARHAVPVIYPWREDVEAGGLMSYGASITDMYHDAGVYAGKILNGATAADLPVREPTRISLVINLRTANALHITVPPALQARADELIR